MFTKKIQYSFVTGFGNTLIYKELEEILYFGDILFSLDDVINRNFELLKQGYVEEWYSVELEKAVNGKDLTDLKEVIEKIIKDWRFKINFDTAFKISEKFQVPLHPEYIYYWTELTYEFFLGLLDWVAHGDIADWRLILPYKEKDKCCLYFGPFSSTRIAQTIINDIRKIIPFCTQQKISKKTCPINQIKCRNSYCICKILNHDFLINTIFPI